MNKIGHGAASTVGKILAVAVFSILGACLTPRFAQADEATLSITPATQKIVLAPGMGYGGRLVVSNHTDQPMTIRVWADSGKDNPNPAVSSWLTVVSNDRVVPAQGQLDVSYYIGIPTGTENTTFPLRLVIEQSHTATDFAANEGKVLATAQLVSSISLEVNSNVLDSISVIGWQNKSLIIKPQITLKPTIVNNTNYDKQVTMQARLKTLSGQTAAETPTESFVAHNHQTLEPELIWHDLPKIGAFIVERSVIIDGREDVSSQLLIILPWQFILGVLLALAGLIATIIMRKTQFGRHYNFNRALRHTSVIPFAITGLLVIGGAAFSLQPYNAYAEVVSIDATVGDTLTLNVCSSAIGINVVPGRLSSAQCNVTVTTNAAYGYKLSLSNADDNTALINTSNAAYTIASTSATATAPAVLTDSTWGFATPGAPFDASYAVETNNANSTSKWAGVPVLTTPIEIKQTDAPAASGEITPLYFAAKPAATQTSGTYNNTVIVSATANIAPAMQTITAATCPGNRTMARDARDNRTYWVRKVGSLCWMETNLAYAGGYDVANGTNTYGDVRTMTLGNGATSGNICYNDYSNACYYTPLNANPTTYPTNPVTTTDGASGVDNTAPNASAQFGYLYNWCAAMGGTSIASNPACNDTSTSGFNTAISVCPAGWRLPIGGSSGEFNVMVIGTPPNGMGWSSGVPTPLFTNGLFMFSGYWLSGSFNAQGTNAYYWSSTANTTAYAYYLSFNTANVNPADSYYKYIGRSVRCVVP